VKRLGILGAGLMGAGVAYVSAQAGIECVLLDRDVATAEKGKGYSAGLVEKAVARGKLSRPRPPTCWPGSARRPRTMTWRGATW